MLIGPYLFLNDILQNLKVKIILNSNLNLKFKIKYDQNIYLDINSRFW